MACVCKMFTIRISLSSASFRALKRLQFDEFVNLYSIRNKTYPFVSIINKITTNRLGTTQTVCFDYTRVIAKSTRTLNENVGFLFQLSADRVSTWQYC